jgi:outer membrane cobalamin receptor
LKNQFPGFQTRMSYAYTYSENKQTGDPLELTPESSISLLVRTARVWGCPTELWGTAVVGSEVSISGETVHVEPYTVWNARIQKALPMGHLYIKVENLLDEEYESAPGFPAASRVISIGFEASWGERA